MKFVYTLKEVKGFLVVSWLKCCDFIEKTVIL